MCGEFDHHLACTFTILKSARRRLCEWFMIAFSSWIPVQRGEGRAPVINAAYGEIVEPPSIPECFVVMVDYNQQHIRGWKSSR